MRVGAREAIAKACYFASSVRPIQAGDQFTTGDRTFSVAGMAVPRYHQPSPPATEPGHRGLEAVSAGRRAALAEAAWPDGERRAVGVGASGLEYQATTRGSRAIIEPGLDPSCRSRDLIWHEPEAIVWTPSLPDRRPLPLNQVSGGLQRVLETARWPFGRCLAVGARHDGTRYYACRSDGLVFIYQRPTPNAIRLPLPEPVGVDWKPAMMQQEWLPLDAVSEGLREALDIGKGLEHPGRCLRHVAGGMGRDGTEYRVHVWRNDFVLIELADDFLLTRYGFVEVGPDERLSNPLAEPEDAVWQPLFPSAYVPTPLCPSRRTWWRFQK